MDFVLLASTSLIASFLTFFSGFGLGTILLPVFAIYYPIEIAVALTAAVHLLNNIFKLGLVSKNINWKLVFTFGIPSGLAAFLGAYILKNFSGNGAIFEYVLANKVYQISSGGIIIGFLIIAFSIIELIPKFSTLSFHKKYLVAGGFISGFFGGLSGHQGAIRTAFLLRLNLDKKMFIATGVMIACLVDVARISLYSKFENLNNGNINYALLSTCVLSAWIGAFIGNKLFTKTSITFFKWFVGLFMMAMGILIALGIVN
ncbi:MAG: sulfite exporter TauE/SafE family protein [Sphingobacteriaceae bacterium]|nr:sulfite exporter TauE/SafE family protein [Sphingobacteriaceae bacterium]